MTDDIKKRTWHLTEHNNFIICNECYEKLNKFLKSIYSDSWFMRKSYYIDDWNIECVFCEIKNLLR